jgi:peptidoglycan/LPS O-acetylase OafA/YrhL
MEIIPQTSREYFRGLAIIHAALIAGQVVFILVSAFLNSVGESMTNSRELTRGLTIAVPLFVLGGIAASLILTKNRLAVIKGRSSLTEKLIDYRSAVVVKLALLEGPAFFAIVSYLLTGDPLFAGIAAFMIVLFFINRPGREKLAQDLELSQKDIDFLDNPDSMIID